MSDETPKFVIRGKVEQGADKESLAEYMAQVMAGTMGIAVQSESPLVAGRPRKDWRVDWVSLCNDGRAEGKIRSLIECENEEELRRTFNVALTIATNGLIAMHQMEFLTALGSVMTNVLATEGGAKEYLHQKR